jgi:hypothetical protein
VNLANYTDIFKNKSVDYEIVFFDKSFFESTGSYSKLMLSVRFYVAFMRFKYILIHQLDCFIFRDELESWVKKGYSYIGAPWLKGYDQAMPDDPVIGVGNGGLSLRNVSDHLRVLLSFSYIKKPRQLERSFFSSRHVCMLSSLLSFFMSVVACNNSFFLFNGWSGNEDLFWGKIASGNFSWFTVAEWEIAAHFSTEVHPRYFYELHRKETPFGCHAWWTYDFEFWKPHIEKFGYHLITHVDG